MNNLNKYGKRTRSNSFYFGENEDGLIKDTVIFAKHPNILKNAKKNKKEELNDDDESEFDISTFFKSHDDNSCYIRDNNIYFNDDITMETMNKLIKMIHELENKLLNTARKLALDTPPPIRLHITTYGGSIIAAYKCINCIKGCKVPIHTIVDGYCASAGTLISIVGTKRYMNKYSNMLVHELRSATSWNKMSEIEDEVENMKKMMEQLKQIYEEHTNMTRSELSKLMKRDLDWDAKECLRRGLIDEIIGEEDEE